MWMKLSNYITLLFIYLTKPVPKSSNFNYYLFIVYLIIVYLFIAQTDTLPDSSKYFHDKLILGTKFATFRR